MKNNILLWGGRSKARIVCQMLKEMFEVESLIIFDNTLDEISFEYGGSHIKDIKNLKSIIQNLSHFVVCIGGEHGAARYKTAITLEALGLKTVDLIHHHSFIDTCNEIGRGCQIMPSATIHKFCKIGDYSIINTNATIDHECNIGNGVHIMAGASIAGKIVIDDFSTIGTNATILPNLRIGRGAFVGAGAVVTKDVDDYGVVVGVPAKEVRKNIISINEMLLEKLK